MFKAVAQIRVTQYRYLCRHSFESHGGFCHFFPLILTRSVYKSSNLAIGNRSGRENRRAAARPIAKCLVEKPQIQIFVGM